MEEKDQWGFTKLERQRIAQWFVVYWRIRKTGGSREEAIKAADDDLRAAKQAVKSA